MSIFAVRFGEYKSFLMRDCTYHNAQRLPVRMRGIDHTGDEVLTTRVPLLLLLERHAQSACRRELHYPDISQVIRRDGRWTWERH